MTRALITACDDAKIRTDSETFQRLADLRVSTIRGGTAPDGRAVLLQGQSYRFAPVVVLVPSVRPLASRIVALNPAGCTVLVVRPLASRKVMRP